ncbi:MAG TPA: enoyl-CoA hydratase/isomerase family protein [Thermoleophilaceae bacterium]|nr:enoyl-CoA hydratase/isomerase family protein [Thermoleophilaceae bacterium]
MPLATLERHGDVGVLTIDAPPLNLFGEELTRDLSAALEDAATDLPRALLIRAEGDVFTGGADVHVFDGKTPAQAREFFEGLIAITHRVEDLPIPTIASVHGLCLTAGFELSLACDMIWAAESARFGLVEIVVGLTPAMGGTQRVAERAGPARARELVMTGGLYEAETLERWNVVNRVVPDEELGEKALRFAERLAAGPTLANAATKRMVRAFLEEGVRGADARVGEIAAPLFGTEDLQRAVRSFLEEGPGKATFEAR